MSNPVSTAPAVIVNHLLGIMCYVTKSDIKPTSDQIAILESAITRMQQCGFQFTFANLQLIVEGPLLTTLYACLPYPGWRILHQMMEEICDAPLADVHDSLQDVQ